MIRYPFKIFYDKYQSERKSKLFTMVQRMQLVGFVLALVLVVGCNGAPSQHDVPRNGLVSPHIVMGRDANIEEFPYMVSIELLRMHHCGGGIITENYVVTAAHCVDPSMSSSTWMKRVRCGSTTEIPIFGWGGTIHSIAEVQFHPKWNRRTVDYDIGVVKVSTSFVYGTGVQPIALAPAGGDNFLDYSRNATISGWGYTSANGQWSSFRLQSVDIPLVQRSRCSEIINVISRVPNITARMLCAAGQGIGDICMGDSGSPLVHKGQVIGVASWVMLPCNSGKYPSAFTNILDPEIRGFIKQHSGI